jgi:kynurenine formamidase
MASHKLIVLALAAALTACATPPSSVSTTAAMGTVVDLSHAYGADTVFWPTAEPFQLTVINNGVTDAGYFYAANNFSMAEHGGTHLDAPVHFAAGKHAVDEIPLDSLIGPAVVVDVTDAAALDADYLVKVSDIEAFESAHGRIPDNAILLIRTGFSKRWPNAAAYLGTAERGAQAVPKLHFPGIDPATAKWLLQNRKLNAVGIDTASIDYGQSTLFESHVILFEANLPAFENVASLARLPAKDFVVAALPMKIRGGTGGPLRIVAWC